jgi:hypothetical protein
VLVSGDNIFPERHVRALDFTLSSEGKELTFSMYDLSDEDYLDGEGDHREQNIGILRTLASEYERWISTSFDMERPSSERMKAALDRNRQACMRSLYRIKEGIDLLATDDDAYAAFCLMNRAIWLQFINKKKAKDAKGHMS